MANVPRGKFLLLWAARHLIAACTRESNPYGSAGATRSNTALTAPVATVAVPAAWHPRCTRSAFPGVMCERRTHTFPAAFVPIASRPGMGHVQIVPAGRVEKLTVTVMEALGPLFNWGDGTKALVKR